MHFCFQRLKYMWALSNIELEKYNIKCEIDNGDVKMAKQELTIGSTLVVLGIVFSSDRLIGYSFIGAGVLLSIIGLIRAERTGRRQMGG